MIGTIRMRPSRHAEFISASLLQHKMIVAFYKWTLKQFQGYEMRYINHSIIAPNSLNKNILQGRL